MLVAGDHCKALADAIIADADRLPQSRQITAQTIHVLAGAIV